MKGQKGLKITIIIQDVDWIKIGMFKCENDDTKKKDWMVKTLYQKYGIDLVPFKPKKDRDLDWLKKDLF